MSISILFWACWRGLATPIADSETFGETNMLHASMAHCMNLPCTTRHHGDAGVGDTGDNGEKASLSLQVVGGQLGVPRGVLEEDHDCKGTKLLQQRVSLPSLPSHEFGYEKACFNTTTTQDSLRWIPSAQVAGRDSIQFLHRPLLSYHSHTCVFFIINNDRLDFHVCKFPSLFMPNTALARKGLREGIVSGPLCSRTEKFVMHHLQIPFLPRIIQCYNVALLGWYPQQVISISGGILEMLSKHEYAAFVQCWKAIRNTHEETHLKPLWTKKMDSWGFFKMPWTW